MVFAFYMVNMNTPMVNKFPFPNQSCNCTQKIQITKPSYLEKLLLL